MNVLQRLAIGIGTTIELLRSMARGRYWWLVPIVLFLLPIAAVLVLLQTVPLVAPFVYTIF
jgi:hypothetical protein